MDEENLTESRLPDEKLEALRILAAAGMDNTSIASAIDVSRKTVSKYRPPDEELEDKGREEEQEFREDEVKGEAPQMDTDESAAIMEIYDSGGDVIAAIKKGYQVDQAKYLWRFFQEHEGVEHPKRIKERLEKVAATTSRLDKKTRMIASSLSDLMKNIEYIISNAFAENPDKNIVWCPHCWKHTYLRQNKNGLYVCARCGRRPFEVEKDE